MIRQAISCDICGSEKRQTNHWFVAFEQGGELRLGGWTSRNRAKPGSKHLCGQTCVHKLVDEFMAKTVASKSAYSADDDALEIYSAPNSDLPPARREAPAPRREQAAHELTCELGPEESSARLISPVEPVLPVVPAPQYDQVRPVTPIRPARPIQSNNSSQNQPSRRPSINDDLPLDEPAPDFSSSEWRAAAWQRERERALRAAENTPSLLTRFRPN